MLGSTSTFVLSLTCFIFILLLLSTKYNNHLPPGPPHLPFIGNLFQTKIDKPWHLFDQWGKEYGPIVYLNFAGQPVIILNTLKAATDLLHHRATNYRNRPRNIVMNYLTRGLNFGSASYGELWRKMRRTSESLLSNKSTINYEHILTDRSALLAHDLLKNPLQWSEHLTRYSASLILTILYDDPILKSLNEPSVLMMNEFNRKIAEAHSPGAYLVEILPVLDFLPKSLAKWKRDADEDFLQYSAKFEEKYMAVKNRKLNGEQRPSISATLADSPSRYDLTDQESAWLVVALYSAALETTASTLSWFLFAMIQFPAVQQKAQQEIDEIVGHGRLPSFSDINQLHYVRAVIKEVLRWRPPLPLSLPHTSVEDDYYDGYLIPKGSTCIANTWSINRDPSVFGQDVDDLIPERHLTDNGKLRDERSEGHFSFGFGTRECVGRHIANKSLIIAVATILWTSSIEPPENSVIPDVNDEEGLSILSRPYPFRCLFTYRHEEAEMVLKHACENILLADER
ncbi:cytochrome P450 [Dendrothele bispora CBS 962.96]|uniref:Cytochrome P450 n=1 Tax=Dendrothele bispora (strain CBS 962.96) TaxID=1314807 RepID=A0A4S8LUK9_DENBC|nr:cytochrome P450 [Dendrothele bispora CBS 962.96]